MGDGVGPTGLAVGFLVIVGSTAEDVEEATAELEITGLGAEVDTEGWGAAELAAGVVKASKPPRERMMKAATKQPATTTARATNQSARRRLPPPSSSKSALALRPVTVVPIARRAEEGGLLLLVCGASEGVARTEEMGADTGAGASGSGLRNGFSLSGAAGGGGADSAIEPRNMARDSMSSSVGEERRGEGMRMPASEPQSRSTASPRLTSMRLD